MNRDWVKLITYFSNKEVTMAKLPYEALKEFYANAIGHRRGQALMATAREYLDEFVFNFDVKEAEPFHVAYKDGQLVVNKGRGQAGPGGITIDGEITAGDLSDLLEGKLGVGAAQVDKKLYLLDPGVTWDHHLRHYFCFWGSMTKVGQDIVISEKVKSFQRWR
jgi:hypothetical protein